jgi:PAS domain-containing protein
MLGYTPMEIHTLFNDKYSEMVYEKDRRKFLNCIEALALKEQTLSLQYRLIRKNGRMIYINDTMTSRRLEDHRMYGFGVIADITDNYHNQSSDSEENPGQFIGPYGFLQCTCEKYPKVTHINEQMLEYLGVTEKNSSWQDFLKENIFFMIPFEERDKFREYLEAARDSDVPVNIEHRLLRSDGTYIPLIGWLSSIENEQDEKEYSIVYMRLDTQETITQKIQENSYFHALTSAYNIIFEINFTTGTVECIHGRDTSHIGTLYDVRMTIESARTFWLNHHVVEEDREMMSAYLKQISTPGGQWSDEKKALQTEFRIHWVNDKTYTFLGVAIHLTSSAVLFCCRDISALKFESVHDRESMTLNKLHNWMDLFVTHDKNAAGMVLLEKKDSRTSITYMSQKIRNYFHIDKNDYTHLMSTERPIEYFVNATPISMEDFEELVTSGQLHFSMEMPDSSTKKNMLITCIPYEYDETTLYEIFVYDEVPSSSHGIPSKGIFARTFGHFDLFCDGVPVAFSSDKEKELMALLIDRNGGTLSTREAISYLWENEEPTEKVFNRYRKLALSLKNTLTRHGIEHILVNNHGVRSIHVASIKCDYYELLAGNTQYRNMFHNVYMPDYSWAEETLATLWDYS